MMRECRRVSYSVVRLWELTWCITFWRLVTKDHTIIVSLLFLYTPIVSKFWILVVCKEHEPLDLNRIFIMKIYENVLGIIKGARGGWKAQS